MGIRMPPSGRPWPPAPKTYTAGEVPPEKITPIEEIKARRLVVTARTERARDWISTGIIAFVLVVLSGLSLFYAKGCGVTDASAGERIEIESREFLRTETDSVSFEQNIPRGISWEPSSAQYMDDTRYGGIMLTVLGLVSALTFYAAGADADALVAPLATAAGGVVLISFSPTIAQHRMKAGRHEPASTIASRDHTGLGTTASDARRDDRRQRTASVSRE